jgi:hypothetical protein
MAGNAFVTTDSSSQIMPAEVFDIIYSDDNPNLIYGIKAKILDATPVTDVSSATIITAKPLNINYVRIPLKGEVVLLLKAPSSYATGIRNTSDTYYLDIVSLQSSIHHNSIPTVSLRTTQRTNAGGDSKEYGAAAAGDIKKSDTPKVDTNFSENSNVKPLQPYIGDVILSGRYGNSIRFSTNPKSGNFKVKPNWTGGDPSAPITIIRNTKQTKSTSKINDFVTEDFVNDDNVVVLASGQKIQFKQASTELSSVNSKGLTSWKAENWGTTPQALISSGRIILNSTQKEIMLFAKSGIGLSSATAIAIDAKDNVSINAKKIELGTDATQPVILGTDFLTALGALTVITPTGPSAPLQSSPTWAQVQQAVSKISFVK